MSTSTMLDNIFDEIKLSGDPDNGISLKKQNVFEHYIKICIQQHLSCAISVCLDGYAHPTDCGYTANHYVYVNNLKKKNTMSGIVFPAENECALYCLYSPEKWLHKLCIHNLGNGRFRIIQSMKMCMDSYNALTHRSYVLYKNTNPKVMQQFYQYQRKYGLPYNLYGYSTKHQVDEFILDMNNIISGDHHNVSLVFGGNIKGVNRATTTLYH